MGLEGQVAVITGASHGIGVALARELSAAGMKLVLTARREKLLRALVAELGDAVCLPADICDPNVPQALIDVALDEFGRLDVMCNNAGIARVGTIEKVDIDALCEMARVNVEAMFRLVYVTLRYFRSVNRGHLMNTSSILGTKVRPGAGAYAATKYAIEALAEALRMEVAGSNIRVTCVQPGLVMTGLHDTWEAHPKDVLKIKTPLQAVDIARVIRYLLDQPDHVRIPRVMVLPGEQSI